MLKIDNEPIDIVSFADELEAGLQRLDKVEVDENTNEAQLRKKIKTAFLYDVAKWIDDKELIFDEGKRKLTEDMIKSYIKEVFIKQQIQGWNFRVWDGEDIDIIGADHFPDELKTMAKGRKLHIVENSKYWFLIGPADKVGQNPYSLRRFLYEDVGRLSIFLTHVIVPRKLFEQPQIKEFLLKRISNILTLDLGVSEEVLHFVAKARKSYQNELKVLLKRPLSNDGRDAELIIHERMIAYEKTLISAILNQVMRILEISFNNADDLAYLYYHIDKLIKDLQNDVEDFQLQPLAWDSHSSQEIAIALMSYRLLWAKTREILQEILNEQKEKLSEPQEALIEQLMDTEKALQETKHIRLDIEAYEQKLQEGGFFAKIGLIRKPKYTLEEVQIAENELKQTFFIEIVRLAKKHRDLIVYAEFETGEIINEKYRHYTMLDSKYVFGMLPRLFILPEDRTKFEPKIIRKSIERNIFKTES